MNCHSVFRLGDGWMAVRGSERGILSLSLPCADEASAALAAGIDGNSVTDNERFGDLATNLAERVIYIVTGEYYEVNVDRDDSAE